MLPPINLIETSSGRYLLFATNDLISAHLYKTGKWEPYTLALATQLINFSGKSEGIIIDAGANLGAFTVPLARQLPEKMSIHSFEVQRIVFYQLCGNIVLNQLEKVHTHHIALGKDNQQIDVPVINYTQDSNIGMLSVSKEIRSLRKLHPTDFENGPFERVEMRTLDSFDFSNVLLLKIDVEGMELDVVQGAAKTLEKNGYPPMLIELWKKHKMPALSGHLDALLKHLSDMGYALQTLGDICIAQMKGRPFLKIALNSETNAISFHRVEAQT